MSKTQKIVLLIFGAGLLVLLLFVVPLNAYVIRSERTRDGSVNGPPTRAYERDKWGTIWDTPDIPIWERGQVHAFFRPDKERMLLSIGSWVVISSVAFVLFGRARQ